MIKNTQGSPDKKRALIHLADRLQTPLYLYNVDVFRDRIAEMKAQLGPDLGLTFSMKASPFLTATAVPLVERIEICSYGEFRIAKALGLGPEKLLLSGVLKKEADVEEMVDYGGEKAVYTVESHRQMQLLQKAAAAHGSTLPVLLRLSSGNQFGMDEANILELIQKREAYAGLSILGLHFFSGTQKKNLRKTAKELTKLDLLTKKIWEKLGFRIRMIEYGTGFSVPLFQDQDEGPAGAEGMAEFKALVKNMAFSGKITVEMGRALAYNAGTYLTRVADLKKTGETRFAIVDGGMHQIHYDGQLKGMYHPFVEVIRNNDGAGEKLEEAVPYTICGSLCTANDVLEANYQTAPLHLGDLIAFHRVGAYSLNEGMSLFLSHEFPAVALVDREGRILGFRKREESFPYNYIH
jgi:diaminopimelate decarboxylase